MSIFETITREYGGFENIVQAFGEEKVKTFSQNAYNAFCGECKQGGYLKSVEWLLRQYSASKKVLLSALFFTQTKELERLGMKNLVFYSAYYALFNAFSSNLLLHPHIDFERVKNISHAYIFKGIENYFIKQGVYNADFLKLLNDSRLMRELYSYHLPLGGLSENENADLNASHLVSEISKVLPSILQASNLLSFLSYYSWERKAGVVEDEYTKHKTIVDQMFFRGIEVEDHLGTRIVMDNNDYYLQGYLLNNVKTPMPISWFIEEKVCEDLECSWEADDSYSERFDITQVSRFLSEVL